MYTQKQHKVVSVLLKHFWCKDEPHATWIHKTHKIHHGSNLGEATTFPLIIYFVATHRAHIQIAFCFGTPVILEPHNFVCRPQIEMKSEVKL
jgi:hypothetical protein